MRNWGLEGVEVMVQEKSFSPLGLWVTVRPFHTFHTLHTLHFLRNINIHSFQRE